jgi:hypothetical protein
MTYEVELEAAKAACAKVYNAEENVKHLASYRLEAGKRIRAAYGAGEAEGKTKAEVAKDIGYSERWVRELANADTLEKVPKAKKKAAARVHKHAKKQKTALANAGHRDDAEQERNNQNEFGKQRPEPGHHKAADPALNESNELLKRKAGADIAYQQDQADDALAAYKEAWLKYCLPHAQKILVNDWRSPLHHNNFFSFHWHKAFCRENDQIHKITTRLRDDERAANPVSVTAQ